MSSFFGKIKSGAEQVAGKAAFEADKLRRIAAEQSAIKGLKEEVEKLTREAGVVAVRLHGEGRVQQPELLQVCRQIEGVQGQIVALEQKLERIRAEEFVEESGPVAQYGRICPRGHGAIAPENNFCQECGAAAIIVPPPQGLVCERCGSGLAAEARFCTECGLPVTRKEPAATQTCTNCGAALLGGMRFCGECGTPVASGKSASGKSASEEFAGGKTAESATAESDAAGDKWGGGDAWQREDTLLEDGEVWEVGDLRSSQPTLMDAPRDEGAWAAPARGAEESSQTKPEVKGGARSRAMDATVHISADALKKHLEDLEWLRSERAAGVGEAGGEGDGAADVDTEGTGEEAGHEEDVAASADAQEATADVEVAESEGFAGSVEQDEVMPGGAEASNGAVEGACPVCGVARLEDAVFCAECGYQFEQLGVGAAMSTAEDNVCPSCDAPVEDADAYFCQECGYQLQQI